MRRLRELGTRRSGIGFGVIVLLVAALLLMFASSVLAGTGKPPASPDLRSLETLWRQYPLGTKRQPIDSRPVRVTPAVRIVDHVRRVNTAGHEASAVPMLGIALVALALLLLTLMLMRTRRFSLFPATVHIRPEGVTMAMFGDRKAEPTTPNSEPSDHQMASRLSRYTGVDNHETPAAAEAIELASDYAQLGEHVGAVLEAATEAATKMRLEAAELARQTRTDAEHQARAALGEAQKQAKQVEADAALLDSEARKQSTGIRKEAEAYADTTRAAADTEAAAVVNRAEREASEKVRATQARLHSLDEKVAATEQRLRQLVGRLRELASSLDVLVSDSAPSEEPEGAASEKEQGSLTDALTQSVAEHKLSTQLTKSL